MFALIFEKGIVTLSWYAWLALRRRVSMSAIGSVIVMGVRQPFSPGFPVSPGLRRSGISSDPALGPHEGGGWGGWTEGHQEALDTPGSSPRGPTSRMQIRQRPNLR